MKIAIAQMSSKDGDVKFNIKTHINAILKASKQNVDYLLFPELSLTGYELKKASKLAFTIDDVRLEKLIQTCMKNKITVSVGAPIFDNEQLFIGTFIIKDDGTIETYFKIHLHGNENKYFSKGIHPSLINIKNTKIANAICADTNEESHIEMCVSLGIDVYAAGVVFSKSFYDNDTNKLASYAKKYNILVLMANYNKPTGGYDSAGKSAIWDKNGLLVSANKTDNILVMVEKNGLKNIGKIISL
jgi:predicted amidohydrolase